MKQQRGDSSGSRLSSIKRFPTFHTVWTVF